MVALLPAVQMFLKAVAIAAIGQQLQAHLAVLLETDYGPAGTAADGEEADHDQRPDNNFSK